MTRRQRLVIVGNGMAGARTAEEVIRRGGSDQFEITVLGAEPHGNYNRLRLGDVVAAPVRQPGPTVIPDELFLNPVGWYADNRISLHSGSRVVDVDRSRRWLTVDDGTCQPYDHLVLATGSSPVVPPIEGVPARGVDAAEPAALGPNVFTYRTLDDASAIHRTATRARVAVVVGGGVLGLEAARALQTHRIEVHIVHPRSAVMDQQLDLVAAQPVHAILDDLGLILHMERRVTRVHRRGDGTPDRVELDDGARVGCDLIVLTAGCRPDVALARNAGLDVDRGIVVDDHLQSVTDERVHAVGECSQHRGTTYGLFGPCWEQAEVLAENLTRATDARYCGTPVAMQLKDDTIQVAQLGLRQPERDTDSLIEVRDPRAGIIQRLIVRNDTLAGALLVGDTTPYVRLTQALDTGHPLPCRTVDLLLSSADDPGDAALADHDLVCRCRRTTKAELLEAARNAAHTEKGSDIDAVCSPTGAGTGCGSCRPLVRAVLSNWAEKRAPIPDPDGTGAPVTCHLERAASR